MPDSRRHRGRPEARMRTRDGGAKLNAIARGLSQRTHVQDPKPGICPPAIHFPVLNTHPPGLWTICAADCVGMAGGARGAAGGTRPRVVARTGLLASHAGPFGRVVRPGPVVGGGRARATGSLLAFVSGALDGQWLLSRPRMSSKCWCTAAVAASAPPTCSAAPLGRVGHGRMDLTGHHNPDNSRGLRRVRTP